MSRPGSRPAVDSVGAHRQITWPDGVRRPRDVTCGRCSITTSMSILGGAPEPGEVMRPLPELTPANEWFWTSGADGTLRIQGCSDCGELVHPPVPICPYCRSRSWKPTPVSGRGTIVGYTVNSHRWLPDFDPPYVIANVALAEDARVHLTTNIVGCDPSDVQIGQEVAVRFEQEEDVWLPLFELTGSVDPVDRVEEPVRPVPRAPAQRRSLRTPGGPQWHRPLRVRPAPHGRPSLAGDRCQPRGDRRCRADARRHRRPVDLPRGQRRGHERGRRQRHRGGPADPPHLDQRWRRPSRTGRRQ